LVPAQAILSSATDKVWKGVLYLIKCRKRGCVPVLAPISKGRAISLRPISLVKVRLTKLTYLYILAKVEVRLTKLAYFSILAKVEVNTQTFKVNTQTEWIHNQWTNQWRQQSQRIKKSFPYFVFFSNKSL
jgi:hypothetical protein